MRHIERIVSQNKGYTRSKSNPTHSQTRTFSDFRLIISAVQLQVNARAAIRFDLGLDGPAFPRYARLLRSSSLFNDVSWRP